MVAELVYVLTLTSPWHGSLSLVLFEFSNLFLMPHHLMTQLRYHGRWHFVNGLLFFVTCTLVRVLGCLALGVAYVYDVATFRDTDYADYADSGDGGANSSSAGSSARSTARRTSSGTPCAPRRARP